MQIRVERSAYRLAVEALRRDVITVPILILSDAQATQVTHRARRKMSTAALRPTHSFESVTEDDISCQSSKRRKLGVAFLKMFEAHRPQIQLRGRDGRVPQDA